jgi:hypothetical protein
MITNLNYPMQWMGLVLCVNLTKSLSKCTSLLCSLKPRFLLNDVTYVTFLWTFFTMNNLVVCKISGCVKSLFT